MPSKKAGGTKASTAHVVMHSTSTAPSCCHDWRERRRSVISPTASSAAQSGSRNPSPAFPDRCRVSQETTATRDS
jgi:hypothetical protein